MTLPVSSYEELLARVRSLTSETIQLRHEITSSLCDRPERAGDVVRNYGTHPQRRTIPTDHLPIQNGNSESIGMNGDKPNRPTSLFARKEDEIDEELKDVDEKRTSPEIPAGFPRNDWGPESLGLWHSGPSSLSLGQSSTNKPIHQDLSGVASVNSSLSSGTQSLNSFSSASRRTYSHQQLGAKVEMVYNLLSLLGTNNREDMSKTFLAMSSSPESCQAMRQSGCLPLLIQLIHSSELDAEVRGRAAQALENIVNAQTDEKRRRREVRVLKLLQQVREYCDELKFSAVQKESAKVPSEKHPVTAIGALMKFSFDAEHRQAICTLGGLQAITELIQLDHEAHGSTNDDTLCITLRRYAGMSLTNLTFGDGKNKALLCSFSKFMRALVDQLKSPSEDLRQVTASVLRNLSWRADSESKQSLREVGAVTALTLAAMEGKKESTLKSILSALWNLSAHCSMNKVDICSVPGALAFLVKMLKYKSSCNTLAIIENAGGIIRNISSHIAVREDYRQILRDNNCFEILLEQLKSPSLTIVSNACGTLWNLSARCSEDQKRLWEMGATSMLRSLVQSKHKMISMGSSAALKNLLTANPNGSILTHLDSTARNLGIQNLPTLLVRKQRALEQELDITLAETCDNIEPGGSPCHLEKSQGKAEEKPVPPKRSDSHESIRSTKSDSVYERLNQMTIKNENKLLDNRNLTLHDSLNERQTSRKEEDQKLMRRYKASMIPMPAFKKMNQEKINERTREESLESEGGSSKPLSKENESTTAKVNTDGKEKTDVKRGIPVLKNRPKIKFTLAGFDQCFGSNFSPQYEEECPINYSLKYSETESYKGTDKSENTERKFKESKKYEEYPDYAETDLDQPTDFSLKYGEKTSSDEDIKNPNFNYYDNEDKGKGGPGYYNGTTESEDTTRTYYTEGTPYEGTPYNFSNSNSMTDLRMDPGDDRENSKASLSDKKDLEEKLPEQESGNSSNSDERKDSSPHFKINEKNCQNRFKRLSREFESGVSTPERPVQYCEEGTPGDCFSRVSSLSSLSSGKESSNKNSPNKNLRKSESKQMTKLVEDEPCPGAKVVKFGVADQPQPSCEDQTPLMFSRCSSMNSLSSFEHITQMIPDDRSSVVSDFSRMTSGVISPSELPDSPTQTVPPSPKRNEGPMIFPPPKANFPQKKSVFEDDVATYKQEDTPIEFSRATSLSSLNIDNSVKSDFIILKTNSTASSLVSTDDPKGKEEAPSQNSLEKTRPVDPKEEIAVEKAELDKDRFELSSVTEVDESILADCINIGIQENSRKPLTNYSRRQKNVNSYPTSTATENRHVRPNAGFPVKSNFRPKYTAENGKVFSPFEASDDAVHTYHTEGTPANISHAGSHSDLSTLSVVSGIPPSGIEDNSDDGSFCSGDTESMLAECIQSGMPKAKPHKDKIRVPALDETVEIELNKNRLPTDIKGVTSIINNRDGYLSNQSRFDYLRRKDSQLTAKDETSTFATENSPCNFSVRSSLSDLTVNSSDLPPCSNRVEACEEASSHALSPVHNVSQPSPSSINLIEVEDEEKASSVEERGFVLSEDIVSVRTRIESPGSLSVESFESSEPTPLEQALLEQCINSGMPHKSNVKIEGNNFKSLKAYGDSGDVVSVANGLSRLKISLPETRNMEDLSKNVTISSAAAEGDTAADERIQKRVVEGVENTKMNPKDTTCHSKSETVENLEIDDKDKASVSEGRDWPENYGSKDCPTLIPSVSDEIEKLRVVNNDGFRKLNDVPNFKIGSEITDSKFLQYEANKICQEIRKYQEMDMGCSLTSEVSLVSCSSFLDAGDYSLLEFSSDGVDFEESENQSRSKMSSKSKNFPFRKMPFPSEPVSLPSLGSLKTEQIETLDLDSSIISVASITSEIAETYSKDYCNTYTKTYVNEEANAAEDEETVEDVTEKGNETLNTDFLDNNPDCFEDDNSLHSQENLPLDAEASGVDSNRRMTPKEKRKAVQDRYRTYTIRDLKGNLTCQSDEQAGEQQQRRKLTPKQKRMNDKNRFLTQTLGNGGEGAQQVETFKESIEDETVYIENGNIYEEEEIKGRHVVSPYTGTITLRNRHEPIKSSKSLDKGGLSYSHSLMTDSKSLNDLLSIGPAERKELVQNAKLVAFSLKTAVHDFEYDGSLLLDSELENFTKPVEIDTATYRKNTHDTCSNTRNSELQGLKFETVPVHETEDGVGKEEEDDDEDEDEDEDEEEEKKGPRILKSEKKTVEESPKGIRGRRKPLYSSPLKHSRSGVSSTPTSPKISQTQSDPKKYGLATTKSLPNVPKSIPKSTAIPSLQREGTFTKDDGNINKRLGPKGGRGIPVLAKNLESRTPAPAVRNKSAPVLKTGKSLPEGSRISRPLSACVAKTGDKRTDSDSSQRRQIAGSQAGTRIASGPAAKSQNASSQGIRNSSSNQSLKSNNSAKSGSSLKSKNSSSQSPKSQSHASLDSVSNSGKPKTPKKEVTSKIAKLWKKVEETKQKGKNVKDSRVWIEAEKEPKQLEEVLVLEREEILDIPTGKIVKSSTFQGISDSETRPEDRSKSCTRGKFSEEKSRIVEGRSVISAIVPPYNYYPPPPVGLSSSAFKQVDTFSKGSLKITTV